MAFMISVVHNFVNNDCTTPKKQKLRNEINWNEMKLNEFSTARKNPSLPLKKNSCENMKWKMIWKKNHHHSTIQPFFDTTKKLNNNEKKMNSNPVWSQILKKNKFMYLKSTYPFFKYNSPKHCPISRKKNAFFASKIKKLSNNYWPKRFWKKAILVFLQ